MNKECLWGVAPRGINSRRLITLYFGEVCSKGHSLPDFVETEDGAIEILIVEESFINYLHKIMQEEIIFDIYIKKDESEWKKVEEDLYE